MTTSTTPATPTIADRIAARFRDDGTCFEHGSVHIEMLCARLSVSENDTHPAGAHRYEFADGSSIAVMDNFWGFGLPDAHCGCIDDGTGRHTLECPWRARPQYIFDNAYEAIREWSPDHAAYIYLTNYLSVGITARNRESTKLKKLQAWLDAEPYPYDL